MANGKTSVSDAVKGRSVKAGALLCPVCCVEYVEVVFDFVVNDVVLYDVVVLRCPKCGEEVFSPKQQEEFRKKSVFPSL